MPYTERLCGIYAILNRMNGNYYIGQSRNLHKRKSDHFNLLRRGSHPNSALQAAFRKYGEENLEWDVLIICDDPVDLDTFETVFLEKHAWPADAKSSYNMAKKPVACMTGRKHSAESRYRISKSKIGKRDHITEAYREKLRAGQRRRLLADKKFLSKVKFIVDHAKLLGYTETAKRISSDPSTVRKLYLRWRGEDLGKYNC